MPSHLVITEHVAKFGEDYRVQDNDHPIKELRSRKTDNVEIGRTNKN